MGANKRQGYTHYRSKRRYEDALQSRNYGEVTLNLGNIAQGDSLGTPVATGELAGSGGAEFFMITSADEVDVTFRIPADFDATATSYVNAIYSVASSTATAADTITPLITYQIPVLDNIASGLGDAASSEGVGNPTAITVGAGISGKVGALFEAEATLSSAFTGVAGGLCHLQVTTKTPLDSDKECRLYNKAVFRYAKDYV